MHASELSFGVAFAAGLVSFVSPCVLPLVPIYLAQLVGQSIHQSTNEQDNKPIRLITFLHSAVFVLGFTLAFVALGATASALGSFLRVHQFQLRQVGGIILIIIGLHMAGILKLPLLYWQKRFEFRPSRPSYPASLLIGIIFGIGWTPCVGLGLDQVSKALKWLRPHLGKIEIGTGVVMIIAGVMIYFNLLLYLNQYFNLVTA